MPQGGVSGAADPHDHGPGAPRYAARQPVGAAPLAAPSTPCLRQYVPEAFGMPSGARRAPGPPTGQASRPA